MNQNSETIRLTIDGDRATLTLNNPARHNALEHADVVAFSAALDRVASEPSLRVLVVTGQGDKSFCAGASLSQLNSGEFQSDVYEQLTAKLEALPLPTICALNGSVYGGGVEIALCCDFRIGLRGSRMFVPPARLGLCYPLSGLQRFVSRLGMAASKRLLIGGETLDAEEMWRIGFLDYLVEPEELEPNLRMLVNRIAGLAPLAVQAMKQLINQLGNGTCDTVAAADLYQRCLESQDLQEGLRASREKRPPRFQGH
jgi:enoyl-CoA hydratase/carnithine racemase